MALTVGTPTRTKTAATLLSGVLAATGEEEEDFMAGKRIITAATAKEAEYQERRCGGYGGRSGDGRRFGVGVSD